MKKLMLFYGLLLALFSASGQSIRDYSTKDLTEDYKIFFRPILATPRHTISPKQFLGNVSFDTVAKVIVDKLQVELFTNKADKESPIFSGNSIFGGNVTLGMSNNNAAINLNNNQSGVSLNTFFVRGSSASTQFGNLNNFPLTFYSNNVERMRISGAGNVGIGTTTNATEKLEVNGNVIVTGSQSVSNILSGNTVNGQTVNADVLQADQSNANILSVVDYLNYGHSTKGTGKFLRSSDEQGNADWSFVPFSTLANKPTTFAGYGITDFNATGDARYAQKDSPTITGITTLSKGSQTPGQSTPSGVFFLKSSDISSTGIEMGISNPVFGGAWIQARGASSTTGQILTLNPTGGNVGIGISNGAKTLSVNGSIGFGGLAVKDLQTELDSKINFSVYSSFSAIPVQSGTNYKLILVLADETNGGTSTFYLWNGVKLNEIFLL